MSSAPRISDADRIPILQKVMFSLGQNMDYVATGLMTSVMWMPFFNIGMGLSPVVLGLVLMVLRAWDAISDPIMGNISDNARTRWGRRRPFMFVGAITTAALYPLMWHFPESVLNGTSWLASAADWIPFIDHLKLTAGEKATALYLIFVGVVFFTSFTMWSMPYYGLQLELTPNYDERTRLTAVMALISKLTGLVTGWTFVVIVFIGTVAQGDFTSLTGKPQWFQDLVHHVQPWLHSFSSNHVGEKPIVTGMRLMCWVIAFMILVFGILPAIFVKERYYAKDSSKQATEPFWRSVKESARCGPLWSLISASFFLVMGYSAIGGLGQYVNIYYVCNGDMLLAGTITGIKHTVLAVSGIAMLPFFAWLGEKYDKRTVVLLMLGMSMFGHLLNYWLMDPAHPYWQIVSGFFESSAIGAVWMFLPSMKADVGDYDEQQTNRRREGSINAFYSWFIKASLTASMGIGGVVLQLTGFDRNFPQQPADVLQRMLWVYLIIPVAIWCVALVSVWFYPLTRKRCSEIRAALEARRGTI
ncbi:MAG TPA: MFS transporter [Rariglobus sp.]|nr:MFS transporter [Rariglobus sp.]